jgi:hypothetical protein
MVSATIHLANRDWPSLINDFVDLDFLPADCDRGVIIPVMDKILSPYLAGGGAKAFNFQALSQDLLRSTLEIPFSVPPYMSLLARSVATLEGIALLGDPNYQMVAQAYPFVVRKVLRNSSASVGSLLRDIVFDAETGAVKPTRLSALLNAALGFVAERTDGFVDLDAVPEDGASLQVRRERERRACSPPPLQPHFFDAARAPAPPRPGLRKACKGQWGGRGPEKRNRKNGGRRRAGVGVGRRGPHSLTLLPPCLAFPSQDVTSFLLSPEARDLRPLLVEELVNGLDLAARDALRRAYGALPSLAPRLPFIGSLPTPPPPPLPVPGKGLMPLSDFVAAVAPELDRRDAIYLQAASQLAGAVLGDGATAPRSPFDLVRLLLSPSDQARELGAALRSAAGDGASREVVADLVADVTAQLAARSADRLGVPVDTLFPGRGTARRMLLPAGRAA